MMRSLLFGLLLCGISAVAAPKKEAAANPVAGANTIVWAGLDYSMVRMYGTMDFRDPETIFPQAFASWNDLFNIELLLHKTQRLQKALGKEVKADFAGMAERNKLAKPDQIIREDVLVSGETHIKPTDIEEAVRSYKLNSTEGVGLVFIVDRLVKVEQKGAVYLVFFDIASRKVISQERVVVRAKGMGFRNYWFRVPKDALPALKKMR